MPTADAFDPAAESDGDLLHDYAATGSRKALGEIVRRHVDLVYGCALRQVRDPSLAEDVTQAVFLILQKKFQGNNPPRDQVLLGGWFIKTTYFASRDALRRKARRIKHERRAAEMRPTIVRENVGHHEAASSLHDEVDQAISKLSSKDRDAIVLRFLQARSFNEVSAVLGVSVDAAEKRVSRALEKLRTMLTAKGVTVPATGLAAALLSIEAGKAPASLMAAGASNSAQSIATSVLKRWAGITSMKAAVVVFALLLLSTIVGFVAMHSGPSRTPMAATPPAVQAVAAPAAPVLAKPVEGNGSMDVLVVDDDGKPLAGVTLRTRNTRNRNSSTLTTDATGHCTIPAIAPGDQDLAVNFDLPGHVPAHAWWPTSTVRGGLPPTYKFTMPRSAGVGGRVVDDAGKPVAGAQVELPLSLDVRGGYQLLSLSPGTATTDAEGRWRCENAPAKWPIKPIVRVSHDQYLSPANEWDPVDENALHAGTLVTKMRNGITINGTVTDTEGRPITGAIVGKGDNHWSPKPDYEEFTTDAAGRFSIPRVPPDESTLFLTARATGYGPELIKLTPGTQGDTPVKIQLDIGRTVRGTVTDPSGKPIVAAYVDAYDWGPPSESGIRPTTLSLRTRSDDKGQFHFDDCPLDSFNVRAYADGLTDAKAEYNSTTDIQKFVLTSKLKIHGAVTDAETGQKVAKFRLVFGRPNAAGAGNPPILWNDNEARDLGDGWYEINPELGGESTCKIRIVADGYAPATSRSIKMDESDVTLNFALKKDAGLAGIVVGPDGLPARGVVGSVITAAMNFSPLIDGRVESDSHTVANRIDVAADGQFTVPSRDDVFDVVFVADAGYVRVTGKTLKTTTQPAAFRLQPWAMVEGRITRHGKPLAAAAMRMYTSDTVQFGGTEPRLEASYSNQMTDADGHFRFDRVIPEPSTIFPMEKSGKNSWRSISGFSPEHVTPEPGKTTRLNLGRLGRPIIGKFVAPTDAGGIDLSVDTISGGLSSMPAELPVPPDWDHLTDTAREEWINAFRQSPAGAAYIAKHEHDESVYVDLETEPGGSFHADDVPPGRYQLYVNVNGQPIQTSPNTKTMPHVAGLQRYLTIPGPPNTAIQEPFDLGSLTLKPDKPTPQPADSR